MRTQSPLSRSETRFLHTLYQSYAGPLYRVAHHRLGDPYLAQDLVQTVFLAAAEKLPRCAAAKTPGPGSCVPCTMN
ncbi:MAG: RNA polymerase sigma factor [Evtepia sp.]